MNNLYLIEKKYSNHNTESSSKLLQVLKYLLLQFVDRKVNVVNEPSLDVLVDAA